MYSFSYLQPRSIAEACAALRADPDSKIIAGGQTLLPSMRLRLIRPTQLLDLSNLEALRGIEFDSGSLSIGAMTRHSEVASDPRVRAQIPALAELAAMIGDRMVRNLGTLGGSIANNDPAADYPAALLGLDAEITTSVRNVRAADFFKGLFETALAPDEVVLRVRFPIPRRAAYVKFRHPASRFALVGVFVADTEQGSRLAVTGAGACAFRFSEMEAALDIDFSAAAIAGIGVAPADLNSDLHASADYRAHLVSVIARRAIEHATGTTLRSPGR